MASRAKRERRRAAWSKTFEVMAQLDTAAAEATEPAAPKAPRWGVYPHAEWDQAAGAPRLTGGGYVVREMTNAVPYARMTPVRTYASKSAADKLSNKLTYG